MLSAVRQLVPTWLMHIGFNRFIESDLAFLHYQDHALAQLGENSDVEPYFTPAQCDRCVYAMRKWIRMFAPELAHVKPHEVDRAALFDRWAQHGSDCVHCRTMVDRMQGYRRGAILTSAASMMLGTAWIPARIAVVISILFICATNVLEHEFKVGNFDHFAND